MSTKTPGFTPEEFAQRHNLSAEYVRQCCRRKPVGKSGTVPQLPRGWMAEKWGSSWYIVEEKSADVTLSQAIEYVKQQWHERAKQDNTVRKVRDIVQIEDIRVDPVARLAELMAGFRQEKLPPPQRKLGFGPPLPKDLDKLFGLLELCYRFAVTHQKTVGIRVEFNHIADWTVEPNSPENEPLLYCKLIQSQVTRDRVLCWVCSALGIEAPDIEGCLNCGAAAPNKYCSASCRSALHDWVKRQREQDGQTPEELGQRITKRLQGQKRRQPESR